MMNNLRQFVYVEYFLKKIYTSTRSNEKLMGEFQLPINQP